MRKEQVGALHVKDLKHVLMPLKRGRVLKDYIDVGFDTEFTAEDNSAERELISLQFSLGKGKSAVYYIGKREGISSEELLNYTLKFLNQQGAEPAKHIYLISHFAIAELCKINDFYDEYTDVDGFKKRPKVAEFNKAVRWQKRFDDVTLHITDLFGHFNTSLDKIGASLNYEKVKIEADGKDHDYWIKNMRELRDKHRDLYESYAIRDAEIAVEAWNQLKEKYAPLNLDPHLYTTYTSLTIAAFRHRMQKLPCKTKQEKVLLKQKLGEQWREHVAKVTVFNDSLDVRELAALSYWGGNNQAFVRGYFKDIQATYWDFISLYIIAGILQPLSNQDTDYKRLKLKDVQDGYEGFAEVEFEFPDDVMYPCLPVQENYYPKLMFPLKGVSYCALPELRQALDLGVQIKDFRSYGFYPEQNEIEHELKPFLSEMLQNKMNLEASGRRNSMEFQIEKAKMVGVIGRFGYMRPSHTAEDIARFMKVSGLQSEEFRKYGRKQAIKESYTRSEVGGSWHIEWASLILGKARSMAAWAVNQGEKCLTISTDGGFWLGNPRFENSELHKKLNAYHSGIRFEGEIDELWVGRNRLYVAWKKGEVVHSAMMGISAAGRNRDYKKVNFEKMVRESVEAGKQLEKYDQVETRRLTGLVDYVHDDVPLNSVQLKMKRNSWQFDGKRRLKQDVNVFKEYTGTEPYETVEEAFREVYGIKEPHRPSVIGEELKLKLLRECKDLTHKQAAEKLGVSVSTIKRMRNE